MTIPVSLITVTKVKFCAARKKFFAKMTDYLTVCQFL